MDGLMMKPGSLKRARLRRFWTQEQLHERSGVSVPTIYRLERGEATVRPGTVVALAEALGVQPEELAEPALAGRV